LLMSKTSSPSGVEILINLFACVIAISFYSLTKSDAKLDVFTRVFCRQS
jgi:hypothetical protein